mmetsp:Transcript_7330/g.27879  ORF Transcript_7330/g.27879 Transcript_7330/m.27879 type:complete len:215 (+) Transcript_7330:1235-1879(+)
MGFQQRRADLHDAAFLILYVQLEHESPALEVGHDPLAADDPARVERDVEAALRVPRQEAVQDAVAEIRIAPKSGRVGRDHAPEEEDEAHEGTHDRAQHERQKPRGPQAEEAHERDLKNPTRASEIVVSPEVQPLLLGDHRRRQPLEGVLVQRSEREERALTQPKWPAGQHAGALWRHQSFGELPKHERACEQSPQLDSHGHTQAWDAQAPSSNQ